MRRSNEARKVIVCAIGKEFVFVGNVYWLTIESFSYRGSLRVMGIVKAELPCFEVVNDGGLKKARNLRY